MAHDVFISHSVKDKTTADAVCAMLESDGVRCWIAPRDVTPGLEWGESIIEAIKECRVMVLVFTTHSNESPQIRREVERAVNHGVVIVPLRVEDVIPSSALEYFIGNVHWLDALTPPLEAHLRSLTGTVKILLARMETLVASQSAAPKRTTAAELPKSEVADSLPRLMENPSHPEDPPKGASGAKEGALSLSQQGPPLQPPFESPSTAGTSNASAETTPSRRGSRTALILIAVAVVGAIVVLSAIYSSQSKSPDSATLQGLNKQGDLLVVNGNFPEALNSYQASCDGGEAAGCTNLGEMYRNGRGVTKDENRAVQYFQKGCDGGDAIGCRHTGFMYEYGRGVTKDESRAFQLYQKGCNGGDSGGCSNLGVMYQYGRGVTEDESRALQLYQKACGGGYALGCSNSGVMYRDGQGGAAKDDNHAAQLFQKACDWGDPNGCSHLGYMYESGRGVAKDESRAAQLYQKGCDGDDGDGCSNLGALYQDGRGIPKDDNRAVHLYQKGCDGGDANGCSRLGYMYESGRGVKNDDNRAVQLFQQSCDGGNASGCTNLGYMYDVGRGVAKDDSRAAQFYQKGCDGGVAISCRDLGIMYRDGRGVAADETRSARLYQRACDLGDAAACANAKK
jgi:uncharacterized protein